MKVVWRHDDSGLEVSREYLVMGILTYKKTNELYFLVNESGKNPWWVSHHDFEIITNNLPKNWFVKINIDNDHVDYKNLIGFNELCNNEDYFNQLLLRDEQALRIYFRRQIELEKEEEDEMFE